MLKWFLNLFKKKPKQNLLVTELINQLKGTDMKLCQFKVNLLSCAVKYGRAFSIGVFDTETTQKSANTALRYIRLEFDVSANYNQMPPIEYRAFLQTVRDYIRDMEEFKAANKR